MISNNPYLDIHQRKRNKSIDIHSILDRVAVMPLPDFKRVNTDLFSLTYGSLISQLLADLGNDVQVNEKLDSMGYNIGTRLINDFLSKTSTAKCRDIRDVADKIKLAFQMYLNVTPNIDDWSESGDEFTVNLYGNPLTEFVELPNSLQNITYLNIIPGIIRGSLEMVSINVRSYIIKDQLKGDKETAIKVCVIAKS